MDLTLDFDQIGLQDLGRAGGKNASLGQMYRALKPQGVNVVDGFATTADAYWRLLGHSGLRGRLEGIFSGLDPENLEQLAGQRGPGGGPRNENPRRCFKRNPRGIPPLGQTAGPRARTRCSLFGDRRGLSAVLTAGLWHFSQVTVSCLPVSGNEVRP